MKVLTTLIVLTLLSPIPLEASSFWMPNGLAVDPDGNVIHAVGFPKLPGFKGPGGLTITPRLGGNAKAHTTIINLTKEENLHPLQAKNYLKTKKIPNDGSGYRVIQTRQGSLSLFVPAGLPIGGGLGVGVGVSMSGGMYHTAVRHVKRYKDIKKLPFISRIPSRFKDFQKYKVNDSITFMTSGSIAFSASVGMGLVYVGGVYLAEGNWVTSVTKTSPVHVTGTYKVSKVKRLMFGGGTTWTNLSVGKMDSLSNLLSYEFNLQDKSGILAYQMFLKGDLLKAREVYLKSKGVEALKGKHDRVVAVKTIKKVNTISDGTSSSMGVNLPFLITAGYSSGTSFVLKNSEQLKRGLIGTNYLGVFKEKSKTTGLLSNNAHRLVMFVGKLQETIQLGRPGEKKTYDYRFAANYKYEYHRDNFDQTKFFEELNYLSRRIGFNKKLKEIAQKIPDKDLGYVQIQADLMISDIAIAGLMKMKSRQELKTMPGKGNLIVQQWFDKDPHHREIPMCDHLPTFACISSYKSETEEGIEMILKGLRKMNDVLIRDKGELRDFVLGMSLMGEGFSKNRFTFKILRRLLKKAGDYHLVVTWQGEKIPKGEIILHQAKSLSFDGLEVKNDRYKDRLHPKTKKLILKFLKKVRKKRTRN